MLRILGGEHRGRRLQVPAVPSTRPLVARARAAVMSHLQPLLPGATVWDVCAGSGILGLEALSRGAARVLAVERSRRAARQLQANAATLGLAERVQVLCLDARAFLELELAPGPPPDVLFYDPPYAALQGPRRAEAWGLFVELAGRLRPGGCAVVHTPRGILQEAERALLPGLVERDYGSTSLYWWHRPPEAAGEEDG